MAQPDGHRPGVVQGGVPQPVKLLTEDGFSGQPLPMREHHLVGIRSDSSDEQPPGGGDAQPPALTHSVVVIALVDAQNVAIPIHKVARRRGASPPIQPGGVILIGDEADLHGVRLLGAGQPRLLRLPADIRLRRIPQGKEYPFQSITAQPGQHVGLVIGDRAPQENSPPVPPLSHPGVVAGGHIPGVHLVG